MPDHTLFSSIFWNRLPVITLLILVVLSLVYVVVNQLDTERLELASEKYQTVGLLGAEAPHYLDYLDRQIKVQLEGDPKKLSYVKQLMQEGQTNELAKVILLDRMFYRHLLEEGHVFWLDSQFKEWRSAREQQVEPIVTELLPLRFGLVAGAISLSDIFTHFWLHTSLLSLMLNAFFAIAFIFYLEERIGKARVFLVFIVSGAVSGLINVLFVPEAGIVSGASGSIAGLVGLYMAFAYDHGVEPRIKKLRVLTQHNQLWIALVAVLFVLKEILEWHFSVTDNLSFIGHVTALILGVISYQAFKETVHDIDEAREKKQESPEDEEFKKEYARALEHLSRLEFEEARAKFLMLNDKFDENILVLRQLYRLEKLTGPSQQYWNYTERLISLVSADKARLLAKEILEDLRRLHNKDPDLMQELDSKVLNKLMMIFINANYMNDAEQVYHILQMSNSRDLLQEACLVLSQAFKSLGREEKVRQYKNMMSNL